MTDPEQEFVCIVCARVIKDGLKGDHKGCLAEAVRTGSATSAIDFLQLCEEYTLGPPATQDLGSAPSSEDTGSDMELCDDEDDGDKPPPLVSAADPEPSSSQ